MNGSRSRSHEPKNGIYERSRVVGLRLEGKLVCKIFAVDVGVPLFNGLVQDEPLNLTELAVC